VYIGTTIVKLDVELSADEAFSIIEMENNLLKGQVNYKLIQNDLHKIWGGRRDDG